MCSHTLNKVADKLECNIVCPGSKKQVCGGKKVASVFYTGNSNGEVGTEESCRVESYYPLQCFMHLRNVIRFHLKLTTSQFPMFRTIYTPDKRELMNL